MFDFGDKSVSVFRVVNGALPPNTPEFRSQMPNGFLERPAKYRDCIFSVQLAALLGVGKVSGFDALEEAGADVDPDVEGEVVEVGVGLHADGVVEEEEPTSPGSIVFLV